MDSVSHAEAYQSLTSSDCALSSPQMSAGSRATWLSSFLGTHLPHNRLRANEDDLSNKFEPVDGRHKRKKKKSGKSKASVPGKVRNLPKRRWLFKSDANVKYSTYIPLKQMWTKYIEELINFSSLKTPSLGAAAQKMVKADLHGCPLSVRRSRNPSYVGLCGIVVQETRNVFVLVTPEDKVKYVPKAHNVFAITLHDHVFTIHGNQFRVKPGDRAAKKFKSKPCIDL